MKYDNTGSATSDATVSNVSPHGIWLLVNQKEYFLPYEAYPWFESATIKSIFNLEFHHETHLHWPDLDVDLELAALERPEDYPLIYR